MRHARRNRLRKVKENPISLRFPGDYKTFPAYLATLPADDQRLLLRHLARTDLFFLLWYICNRDDLFHPWLYARCQEVQASPNGHLDLWFREGYKSTIISFGKTLQDILTSHGKDPFPEWCGRELSVGLFSCTRPLAKNILRQIKLECENNGLLRALFPDILWENPQVDAPKWSEDDGLIVKRRSNPRESTVEAWGLVDGQPTGKHFYLRVYDDVVTIDFVRSAEMIKKTTQAWELSTNLGALGGLVRYIGTRYHYNDTYKTMLDRGIASPRIHPATVDGTPYGEPVFLSKAHLDEKRKTQGIYTFSSQMLLDPVADKSQGFQQEWLQFYKLSSHQNMNRYIVVDPATAKKTSSDYTAMLVIGLGPDENYYILDMIRDRLSLRERAEQLLQLHRRYRPLKVGYEQYGMQADLAYIEERQGQMNYRFPIIPLKGSLSKVDRIRGLLPFFESKRFYLPDSLFKTNYEGMTQDVVDRFIHEEYLAFPATTHDDMLDCLARILDEDLGALFPKTTEMIQDRYAEPRRLTGSGWAS